MQNELTVDQLKANQIKSIQEKLETMRQGTASEAKLFAIAQYEALLEAVKLS